MTEYTDKEIKKRFENVTKSKTFKNIIRTLALDSKRVLDLGCSYGEFLIHFGTGSVGITVSEEEVEYGGKKGLSIIYGNAERNLPVGGEFEAIFANNIFEHLYSPHGFLVNIRPHLADGGVLVLGVPCIPKIASLVHLKKFRGSLAVAHINFFTRITLRKTVERSGYTVHTVRSFHFKNKMLDALLNPIAPHLYVVATPKVNFEYHEKRKKELKGYE